MSSFGLVCPDATARPRAILERIGHLAPAAVDKLAGVAADSNTPLPRLALSWVVRSAAVSVAHSGCRSPREIDGIMAGTAGQTDVVPGRHYQPPAAWSGNPSPHPLPHAPVHEGGATGVVAARQQFTQRIGFCPPRCSATDLPTYFARMD